MKRFTAVAVMAIALLCHACNVNNERPESAEINAIKVMDQAPPEADGLANSSNQNYDHEQQTDKQTSKKQQSPPDPPSSTYKNWDRKIIRTANIRTEVQDLKTYTSNLRLAVRVLGGYVSEEQMKSDEYSINGDLTIKIPVDMFERAVAMVSDKTTAVHEVNIRSQDVSTEMVDVKARLEVRRTMRDRYMQLMQGAKNMEDLLKVQTEVNGLQEEIESGMSRVNYLQHATSLSTIHLSSFQKLKPEPVEQKDEAGGVKKAFMVGWNFLGDFLIGLLTIWPVLLLTTIIIVVFRKRLGKKG